MAEREVTHRESTKLVTGMTKADMKAAVLKELVIGNFYKLRKIQLAEDERNVEICKLVDLYRNTALFEREDGIRKCYGYAELCTQMTVEDVTLQMSRKDKR